DAETAAELERVGARFEQPWPVAVALEDFAAVRLARAAREQVEQVLVALLIEDFRLRRPVAAFALGPRDLVEAAEVAHALDEQRQRDRGVLAVELQDARVGESRGGGGGHRSSPLYRRAVPSTCTDLLLPRFCARRADLPVPERK